MTNKSKLSADDAKKLRARHVRQVELRRVLCDSIEDVFLRDVYPYRHFADLDIEMREAVKSMSMPSVAPKMAELLFGQVILPCVLSAMDELRRQDKQMAAYLARTPDAELAIGRGLLRGDEQEFEDGVRQNAADVIGARIAEHVGKVMDDRFAVTVCGEIGRHVAGRKGARAGERTFIADGGTMRFAREALDYFVGDMGEVMEAFVRFKGDANAVLDHRAAWFDMAAHALTLPDPFVSPYEAYADYEPRGDFRRCALTDLTANPQPA